jgi:hypothetical protein
MNTENNEIDNTERRNYDPLIRNLYSDIKDIKNLIKELQDVINPLDGEKGLVPKYEKIKLQVAWLWVICTTFASFIFYKSIK